MGRLLGGSVLGLVLLWGWAVRVNAEDEVVVAVNPATPAGTTIARNALSAIFGMRLRAWADGTPIRVYVLPDDNAVHVAFSKADPRAYSHTSYAPPGTVSSFRAPVRRRFRSATRRKCAPGLPVSMRARPEVVGSEEEMREKLAQNAGAIGYLSKKMIDERVAVLQVE